MNPGILRILATPIAPKTTCFFALPGPEANRHIPDAEKTLAWKIKEKWPADAHRLWVQLGEAPDGSLKNRIFATGTRIMDGIPEEGTCEHMAYWARKNWSFLTLDCGAEWFLKSVRYGNRAELVVPDFVNADQMIEQLKELCETR